MAITPTASTTPVTTPTSNASITKLSGDLNTFLKLLTTQLQNQDPTSPMDTDKMTDQLTQFSQVEQQISSNSKLDSILAALKSNSGNQSLDYLGRVVEFDSSKLALMTVDKTAAGIETKQAVIAYNLPNVAKSVDIQIIDPKTKQVVRTIKGDGEIGRHTVAWDGKNDSGAVLPNDVYDFKVVAKDKTNADMANVKTSFISQVYSLENGKDGAKLDVGMGLKITPDVITQVHAI